MWVFVVMDVVDGMVVVWFLNIFGIYYKDYKGKFEDLGLNLKGVKIGLVVLKYMININFIEDLKISK